jgi:hypothetical protein
MSWFSTLGRNDTQLAEVVEHRVRSRIESGAYAEKDVLYMERHRLSLLDGRLEAEQEVLEGLRKMAQASDVRLTPPTISSHRPYLGPVIVAVKKVLFRVLEMLLREQLRRQRDFNARTLETIIKMQQSRCRNFPK